MRWRLWEILNEFLDMLLFLAAIALGGILVYMMFWGFRGDFPGVWARTLTAFVVVMLLGLARNLCCERRLKRDAQAREEKADELDR